MGLDRCFKKVKIFLISNALKIQLILLDNVIFNLIVQTVIKWISPHASNYKCFLI